MPLKNGCLNVCGQIELGIFAPEKCLDDWGDNAREEIADFINYMRMEQAELICSEESEPIELEAMLEELRTMEQSAKILYGQLLRPQSA